MPLIICASDMGLTCTINIGAIEAIDHGCIGAASVLLNMPGSGHALSALAERPWVSFLWQISERGRNIRPKTPADHGTESEAELEAELEAEFEAELEAELNEEVLRAIRIYGKAPCAALIESPKLKEAAEKVCRTYGVRTSWLGDAGSESLTEVSSSETGLGFDRYSEYDPRNTFINIPEADDFYFVRMYPGFLDDISLSMTINEERNVHRLSDQRLLCSESFRKEMLGKYRLINLEDAFTGRRDFENHYLLSADLIDTPHCL